MDDIPRVVVGIGPLRMMTAPAWAHHGVACPLSARNTGPTVHAKRDLTNPWIMEHHAGPGLVAALFRA